MSVQYGDVPAGGVMNVPPAIPSGMLYRVKQIMSLALASELKKAI